MIGDEGGGPLSPLAGWGGGQAAGSRCLKELELLCDVLAFAGQCFASRRECLSRFGVGCRQCLELLLELGLQGSGCLCFPECLLRSPLCCFLGLGYG